MSAALNADAHRSANASKLLSCTLLDGGDPGEGWKATEKGHGQIGKKATEKQGKTGKDAGHG
jgi:hypothetical protein